MKNDFEGLAFKHLFVPFVAERVAQAVVVARHPRCDLTDETLLARYAYAVPREGTGRGKVFYAERYGGDGISFHGGGARCGYDGQFQLKGIVRCNAETRAGALTRTGPWRSRSNRN
ncbi:hypothetical protein AB4851_00790 [Burkholderia sp. 22PA0099]|uniref:hypothetical protein n=1 Tax=Burkholderia sp. 22PA0099 TaxID=3237372 RepID=UPI0039C037EB